MRQLIHDGWQMCAAGKGSFMPAAVPGSVYADLRRNNQMPDPYFRDNELIARAVMQDDFEYRAEFDANLDASDYDRVYLRFSGLDTLAGISLNDERIAKTDNMHRTWEFDVTGKLSARNRLEILFHSPTRFAAEAYEQSPNWCSHHAMRGYTYIRKAACMFGWDWGARLPDAGIWRDCELIYVRGGRLVDVYFRQTHENGAVTLTPTVETEAYGENATYTVTITAPGGAVSVYENSPKEIVIDAPKLWFPNGYGDQHLYTAQTDLYVDGQLVDTDTKRVGLRTITMRNEPDEYGESFAFVINGLPIFSMGANYIPEDSILANVTPERTRRLLEDCKLANFNTIRVWGGGYYPDDFFFDICDELGLIVWQDSLFACAAYRVSDGFYDSVEKETADNMKRLRHHASLGIWCGNNEIESQIGLDNKAATDRDRADYIILFEHLIKRLARELLPETFYWPSSPSTRGAFENPNDPNRGDQHYWDVWHASVPFTEYRKYHFRFASEFGFQSFPSLKTIETFTDPEDRNPFSYVCDKHQRNEGANAKIMGYMGATYRYPNGFGKFIYASQLLQADAIKYGVEHWRRNRGRCMGALYWQLNDNWPVVSWASVDYFGRWKALHYYAKRFFAPIAVSCEEEGFITQGANINAETTAFEKSAAFSAANETGEAIDAEIRWALRGANADILRQGSFALSIAPYTSRTTERVDFADADLFEHYVSYELFAGGEVVSSGTTLFGVPKYFNFKDPGLRVVAKDGFITVKAAAYAKSVYIYNDSDDLVLDDNYFDLNAGERTVKILRGEPTGLKAMSAFDIR